MLSFAGWTLALAGSMGVAASATAAEALPLDAAIRRTLENNPTLRAEGATMEALQQQAQLDDLKPAMTLGAELENVAGTGALSGLSSAETTLRLGQVIELGGKRAARQARGRADVERQRNVLRQRQLDLAAETTRRYISVAEFQEELALTQRQTALARETEAAAQQRVKRGVAPEGDVAMARIAVVRAEIEQEHADHELASARFALATLWGEAQAVDVQATGDLLALPALADFDVLALRLPATPEMQAFAREQDRLDAEQAIARAAATPDLSVSLGVRRLEALDDQGLVMSIAIPFGSAQRSSLAVARASAEGAALDARREVATLESRQKLFAKYQELRHAHTEYAALTERMIPAAEHGLALTQAGYDNARYSIVQLTQAQATVLQLQQERLAAAARYHQLLADIERSTAAAGENP